MKRWRSTATLTLFVAFAVAAPPFIDSAVAASARELEAESRAALRDLYATTPSATLLASKAKAILVFPGILKAGFMFGGQIGEGVRIEKDKVKGYYSSVAASYGLQAGIQKFGYALFFMNNSAAAPARCHSRLRARRRPEYRDRR